MHTTEDNTVIFISWSGIQSKEVAKVLKSFLREAYHLDDDEIFLSAENLHGSDWPNTILLAAKNAHIGITCLTSENHNKPWILLEYGAMSVHGAVCPVFFNFPIASLPNEYNDIYLREMCRTPFVPSKEGNTIDFKVMLEHFIIDVDKRGSNGRFRHLGINTRTAVENDKRLNLLVETSAAELMRIYHKYNKKAYFISRPMQTTNHQWNEQMNEILESFTEDCVFYSKGTDKEDIAESRIENIRKSQTFVLIYPDGVSHSSCLLEVGAAMALGKRIILCIQNKDSLPFFLKDWIDSKKYEDSENYYKFSTMEELSQILSHNVIKLNDDK